MRTIRDFEELYGPEMDALISDVLSGTSIVSGCEPSVSGTDSVQVNSGIVSINGTQKELSSATVSVPARESFERYDLILSDSNAAVVVQEGNDQLTPSIPFDHALIGIAKVPPASNSGSITLLDARQLSEEMFIDIIRASSLTVSKTESGEFGEAAIDTANPTTTLTLPRLSSDPTNPSPGDIWINTDIGDVRIYSETDGTRLLRYDDPANVPEDIIRFEHPDGNTYSFFLDTLANIDKTFLRVQTETKGILAFDIQEPPQITASTLGQFGGATSNNNPDDIVHTHTVGSGTTVRPGMPEYNSSNNDEGKRKDSAVAVVDGTAYIVGGEGKSGATDWNLAYDLEGTSSLGYKTDCPIALDEGFGFGVGGYAYICDSSNTGEMYRYDPSTDSWSQRTGNAQGIRPAAATYNGNAYAFGDTDATNSTREYVPAQDTWNTKADMPTPVQGAIAATYEGTIYVCCGFSNNGHETVVQGYDPDANSWSTNYANAPKPASFGCGDILNDGRIYIAGGFDGSSESAEVMAYDPAADSWDTSPGDLGTGVNATAGGGG